MKAIEHLMQHKIKPSLQRIAIMDYLMSFRTHPTVDEIYNSLLPSVPTLSKTTVYNTLKLFEKKGAVLSIGIDEKMIRFDGYTDDHAHFICLSCGCIYDLPIDQSLLANNQKTSELTITQAHLYYKGYCEKCKGNKE